MKKKLDIKRCLHTDDFHRAWTLVCKSFLVEPAFSVEESRRVERHALKIEHSDAGVVEAFVHQW